MRDEISYIEVTHRRRTKSVTTHSETKIEREEEMEKEGGREERREKE